MTTKQRNSILLNRWPAVCSYQGWNKSDRVLRLRVISLAVGRTVTSMSELNNGQDIDDVYAYLGMLVDNVRYTVETLPARKVRVSCGPRKGATVEQSDTPGLRRRYLWLIRQKTKDLGEGYLAKIARDRFHLTAGFSTIEDLTTKQLHDLMVTLHARLDKRERALEALHEIPATIEPPIAEVQDPVYSSDNAPF